MGSRNLGKVLSISFLTLSAAFSSSGAAWAAGASFNTPFELDLVDASAQTLIGGINLLNNFAGEVNTALPDQTITSPYTVHINGIQMDVKYAFNPPVPTGTINQWAVSTKDVSADVTVGAIDASQVITQKQGNTTVTITVNASCKNVQLHLNSGTTHATGLLTTTLANGKLGLALSNFAADWTPSAWTIVSLNCTGPVGFQQLVTAGVETELRTINPFIAQIQAQIQAQLNATAGSAKLAWTMNVGKTSGVSVTLQPQDLQAESNGSLAVRGNALLSFANVTNAAKCGPDVTEPLPAVSQGNTAADQLVLPYEALRHMVSCLYYNGNISETFTGNGFAALQSFMGNWFEKLFVWPDLARWSSADGFNFVLRPTSEPVLSPDVTSSGGTLNFNLSGNAALSVYAPIQNLPRYYVDLKAYVAAPAHLSVNGGVLTFKQDLPPGFDFQAVWDKTYVRYYHPNQYIDTGKIAQYVSDWLSQTGVSYKLPSWTSPGAFSLGLDRADVSGDDVVLRLKVTNLRPQPTPITGNPNLGGGATAAVLKRKRASRQ